MCGFGTSDKLMHVGEPDSAIGALLYGLIVSVGEGFTPAPAR